MREFGGRNSGAVGVLAALLLVIPAVAGGIGAASPPAAEASPLINTEFRVTDAGATWSETSPTAVFNADGNLYFVAWSGNPDDAIRGSDVFGRRMRASISRITRMVRVSDRVATADEYCPVAAWNDNADEYFVVWRDGRNLATGKYDVYGRRVGADGKPIGRDIRISGPGATETEDCPDIAYNATADQYLVVWGDRRGTLARDFDVFGRRVAADGSLLGQDFRISGRRATDYDYEASVAWNATANEYLVVWEDGRNFVATNDIEVWGRRVGADGSRIGADFRIARASETPETGILPDLAWNGTANEYLVVWKGWRGSARNDAIMGRRIAPDGSRIGTPFRVSDVGATAYVERPAVAWNGRANRYLVVWEDHRDHTTRRGDVYGRLLEANGSSVGRAFRVCGVGAVADEVSPAIAPNSNRGEFLVVWQDFRGSPWAGVYGRRVAG